MKMGASNALSKKFFFGQSLWPVTIVVFFGVAVSTLLAYFYTKSIVTDLALGYTSQALRFLDHEVRARVADTVVDLKLWSREETLRQALGAVHSNEQPLDNALPRLAAWAPPGGIFDKVYLFDVRGDLVLSSAPMPAKDIMVRDRAFFRRAMNKTSVLATLEESQVTKNPVLVAAVPVTDGAAVIGVLAASLDIPAFAGETLREVSIGTSGRGYLIEESGFVLASPTSGGAGAVWSESAMAKVKESAQTGKIVLLKRKQGGRMLAARHNSITGWYLVIAAREAEVLRPATRLAWISGAISAVTLALVLLALSGLHRALTRLKHSEEKFAKLFLMSPDGIVLMDRDDLKIEDVNETFITAFGFRKEEVLGKTLLELHVFAEEQVGESALEQLQRTGKILHLDIEFKSKSGAAVDCALSGQSVEIGNRRHGIAIIRDVTEVKKMHAMMIQTEKMISLGGIAAGIAHEINNPLGIILQAVQSIMQRTKPGFRKNVHVAEELGLDLEVVAQYLHQRQIDQFAQDIKDAAVRASEIVKHMLDFSRRSESRRTICDLRAVMDKAITLAGNDYNLKKHYDFKKIDIVRQYDEQKLLVNCTETEIEQVFLNVLRNAAQAMMGPGRRSEDPRIIVQIRRNGPMARIDIQDNGPGVSEDLGKRIFEPFFTTKAPNTGTGLGLSVSYFIVTKGHNGTMDMFSSPGQGAVFTIELPFSQPGDGHGDEANTPSGD
jgi:PAS domain S-box-containing protein